MTSLAVALLVAAAPAAGTASAAVQTAQDHLRTALDHWFSAQGEARTKARDAARASVSELIDFEAFAKETLGDEWAKRTPKDRERYVAALQGALEANYLHKMRAGQSGDVAKVQSTVMGEEKKGEHTLVHTKVQSGTDSIGIDYLMQKGSKGWRAVDVVTDGVSTAETYQSLVSKTMAKDGFDGVIGFFEKKKKSIEASDEKSGAPANTAAAAPAAKPRRARPLSRKPVAAPLNPQ